MTRVGGLQLRACRPWLLVGLAVIAVPANCGAAAAVVLTTSGSISGLSEGGLSVYEGVPFAAAPVGELRWRPPEPVAPWTGTRTATTFAPACMQEGVSMPGEVPPKVSEDCLFLNVWAPAKRAAEPLPVIVWIYGGGYRNGSASMPLYWGDQLARKGVIVVTIAYRLGPLGFLALPELRRESSHGRPGITASWTRSRRCAGFSKISRHLAVIRGA
jgi:para-nitrobenzyl esterase